ncbi:MAG: cbb3-type cytochrome c oxidase N-terminal domain-containing protein [Bacteroidota bacterium]|nr:cbb3-type cytochrome c oxidase N-terminal domain-containing protein [Bacteroidota bacterium]
MRFKRNLNKKIYIAILAGMFTMTLQAQSPAETAAATTSSDNHAQTLMIVVAFLLAFVIWGLGQVVTTLARKTLEKNKEANKVLPTVLVLAFSLWGYSSQAQEKVAETVKTLPNYGGMSANDFWLLASVISTEIIIIIFLLFFIKRFERELLPQKAKAKSAAFSAWWSRIDKKLFTKAVPIEREADILLDHDYDGIRELDNALPPWWKYGFYITIGIAIVYLLNYEVLGYGENPTQEYNEEMAKAKIQMEAYAAKSGNTVDENNIKMPGSDGLAKGKEIFTTTCWPCHGKLGEGGVGPNLTDDYWLHKGSLKDIFESIKNGYPDKGMQSWEKTFSAVQINDLAGYIKSLRGTNPPNGKAPQGDLYTEDADSGSPSIKK